MSKGKKMLFKYNVILPWVIMICIVFSLQIQCEKGGQEEPPKPAVMSAEKVLQMEIKFHKDLEKKFFKHLKDNYKIQKFELMADKMVEFGEKISFYDLKGDVLKEKEKCINFWKDVYENKKVKDVDFTILSLRVIPVAEPVELKDSKETVIATGHAVFIYRLIKEEEGKITNSIGSGTYNARHPGSCEW